MTKTSENASAMTADDIGDDDTIELALTAEDVLALSRAAEEASTEAGQSKSALTSKDAFHPSQSARFGSSPGMLALLVLGIAVTIALGLAAGRVHTVQVVASAVETVPTESLEPPVVRFNNPFDASEVFEFPPGTSDDKARESVAALLLERARDRQRTEVAKSRLATHGAAARARMARNSESHLTGPADEPRWR